MEGHEVMVMAVYADLETGELTRVDTSRSFEVQSDIMKADIYREVSIRAECLGRENWERFVYKKVPTEEPI